MKRVIKKIVFGSLFKKLIKPFVSLNRLMETNDYLENIELFKQQVFNYYPNVFNNKQVLNGPFKTMQYPSLASCGSTFTPKLIGSYEAELHPVIEEIIERDYSEIIDIGCAEGYYAIGLAMRCKNANVKAFDIDKNSQKLCVEMAVLNKVDDKVEVLGECTAAYINSYHFSKGLIISDCEGFELPLFKEVGISKLNCDYLIEVHEWPLEKNMEVELEKLFTDSHFIQKITSHSDLHKAKHYDFFPVGKYEQKNLAFRYKIFAEVRGGEEMTWFYCKKK